MNVMVAQMRRTALGAAVLALTLGTGAWGTERASFPGEQHVAYFRDYMDLSDGALENFDRWTAGKVNQGDRSWINDCNVVLRLLERSYREAAGDFGELPDSLVDWYEAEVKAWENVSSIGADLIRLHDAILETTGTVEAYRRKAAGIQDTIVALAPGAHKVLEILAGLPGLPDGLNPEIEAMVEDALKGPVSRMTRLLTQLRQDAERLGRVVERERYPDRLKTLRNKDIDPDQDGVFVRHERIWEKNLQSVLERFQQASRDYADTARPVLQGEVLAPYAYFRGAADRLMAHVERWVETQRQRLRREARELGSPRGEIQAVGIRDFREPGDAQDVRVRIRNSGKIVLRASEWSLECSVASHPDHYRPKRGDFDCGRIGLRDDLEPGKTYTFVYRAEAPEGTGDWTLRWALTRSGETVSERSETFKVLGEVDAEIMSVHLNRRDVVNLRRIEPGKTVDIKVRIRNLGTDILFKNRCQFVGKVLRRIEGKDSWRSFRFDRPLKHDVAPGESIEFTHRVDGPKEEGRWLVQIEFRANRRSVAAVEKEVVAELGR